MRAPRLALGAAAMTACNIAKVGIQLGLTPVMARLLGPSEFGVFSLAQPSILFVMMLADGGLGQSLSREPEEHDLVWSSAFWIMLATSVCLAAAVAVWAFPLAWLAHEQRLPPIVATLSLCVVILSLTVAPSARLTRRGRLGELAIYDLIANALGGVVAVISALNGAGVWSLVAQFVTVCGTRAAILNAVAFHRPALVFSWKLVAPHTMLGGTIVLTRLAESVGRMAESAALSRRFGAAALGMFSFSGQAAWSMVQSVNNPTWTYLYVQALDPARSLSVIEATHKRLLRLVALTSLPATAIIAALAGRVTAELLGPTWIRGVLLIALIFPSQALGSLGHLSSAALYAKGRIKWQTWIAVAYVVMRVGSVSLPLGGWGAVPWLIAAANLVYFGIGVMSARLQMNWSLRTIGSAVRGPAVASVIAAAATYKLAEQTSVHGIAGLLVLMTLGSVVFLVALVAIDFKELQRDISEFRAMTAKAEPVANVAV